MTNPTSRIIPNTITLAPTIAVKSPAKSVIPSKKLQELAPKHLSDIKTVWNAFYEAPGQKIQAILQNRTALTLIFLSTVAIGLFVYYRNQKSERSVNGHKLAEGLTFTGLLGTNDQPKGPGKWVMTTKEQQRRVYEGTFTFINGNITGNGTWTCHNNKGEELFNYVGTIKNGKYEGGGTLKLPNGQEYTGEFKENYMHGKGIYVFGEGDTYEGDFFEDNFHGNGVFTWDNGNVYKGKFEKNQYHGQGTFTFAKTNINNDLLAQYNVPRECTGNWKNDWLNLGVLNKDKPNIVTNIHFNGHIHLLDSDQPQNEDQQTKKFKGIFVFINGVATGNGTCTCYNDNEEELFHYIGPIENGKYHGKGTLKYSDGEEYTGDFKENMYNGLGTLTLTNGTVYTGDFKEHKYCGNGILTLRDGAVYIGNFEKGLMLGKGKYIHPDGNIYEGDFVDENFNGDGVYTFTNGNVYKGTFENNNYHGQGTFIFADTAINQRNFEKYKIPNKCTGTWENDWLILGALDKDNPNIITKIYYNGNIHVLDSSQKESDNSTITQTIARYNGDIYVGDTQDNLFDGQGTITYSNGNKYEGRFAEGDCQGEGTFTFAETESNREKCEKYNVPMICLGTWEENSLELATDIENTIKISGKGNIYTCHLDADGKRQETFIFVNGNVYTGEFQDNQPHGKGILTINDDRTYEVTAEDGEILSVIDFRVKDECAYTGPLNEENQPTGPGKWVFNQTIMYKGAFTFTDGVATGNGTYTCYTNDGEELSNYIGPIKDGKYEGEGTFTSFIGKTYTGGFKDGKYSGKGALSFGDGTTYIGDFLENSMYGVVKATFANGNSYTAIFENDQRHGEGTFTFADTESNRTRSQTYGFPMVCEGTWEQNWLDLKTTTDDIVKISTKGNIYISQFDANENQQKTFIFANGDVYTGEFLNNEPHGNGTLTLSDGIIRTVKAKNGKIL